MPFALLIAGALLIVTGVRDTQAQFFALVKNDFTAKPGQTSFVPWLLSILILGAIGYVEELKPFSRAFLVLVLVILLLKEGRPGAAGGGFFQEFQSQVLGPSPAQPGAVQAQTYSAVTNIGNLVGSGVQGMMTPGIFE